MPTMPRGLIVLIVGLCLFAWFMIGERKNFGEKLMSIVVVVVLVVIYRMCHGDTLGNMLSIVRDFIFGR